MTWNTAILRRLFGACSILLLLAGCGGGGGGSDSSSNRRYSISLSSSSLTFSGAQFTSIAAQTVTATFKGDGVVVGTLPGQSLPSWLSVTSAGTASGDRAEFSIQVGAAAIAVGTYTTTLRFATGNANGSDVVFSDLAVTLNLREGFSASPNSVNFTAVEGGSFTPAQGQTIQITGENVAWSVQAPSWLQLSATSGNARGNVVVTPNMTGLEWGRYQEWIRVSDSVTGIESLVLAVVEVVAPQLTVSETQFNVTLDSQTPDSGIHHSVVISDTAQGQNSSRAIAWTASSNSPLLTVAPPSGSTAGAPTTVTIDFDRDQLNGLRTGTHNPSAIISYPSYNNTYVRFNLAVALPRANSALPYILAAGTPATVTLLGEDFTQADIDRLRLNDQPLSALGASATLTSVREIALSLPALAANDYGVSFHNQLGLRRSAAAVKVASALTPGAGEMVGTGNRVKLLFDAARSRLYGVDTRNGEIERYEWNGTQWTALSTISQLGLKDADLMRDGRHLAMSATDGLRTINLDTAAVTFIPGSSGLICNSGWALNVAATSSGSLFATSHNSCGSGGSIQELDLLSGHLGNPAPTYTDLYFTDATLATSGDGRVVAIGSTATSGGHYGLFDLNTRTFIDRGDWGRYSHYYYYRMSLDRAGTKVLFNNTYVRDRTGATVGLLPTNVTSTISANGTRAYIYVHGAGGTGHVAVFNLSTPVGSSNTYPQIGPNIPVPQDMGTPDPFAFYNYGNVTSFGMTLSSDEQLLFIAGSTRIVAIDLP